MTTQSPSDTAAKTEAEFAALVPIPIERLTRVSERFIEGMTTLVAQQMELGRLMMEGGVEDFRLLAQATTPETFIKAEFEVLNRRQERAAAAVRKFNDGFHKAFSDVYESVEPSTVGGRGAVNPAPSPSPSAH